MTIIPVFAWVYVWRERLEPTYNCRTTVVTGDPKAGRDSTEDPNELGTLARKSVTTLLFLVGPVTHLVDGYERSEMFSFTGGCDAERDWP